MKRIQESVLVSTLKSCSALLTHSHLTSVESFNATKKVGLLTGTVPVGRFTGGKGLLPAESVEHWPGAGSRGLDVRSRRD